MVLLKIGPLVQELQSPLNREGHSIIPGPGFPSVTAGPVRRLPLFAEMSEIIGLSVVTARYLWFQPIGRRRMLLEFSTPYT